METSIGKGVVIIRQDRNSVRTAQDLERKYNLTALIKTARVFENTLNKTNQTLEDFIYATIGSLDSLEGIIDGNITTYYHSGVPTMENFPVSTWTEEEYSNHIDDLYYDKDTGYAYVFFLDPNTDTYGWERTNAKYIIQAMAMANSASDTADGKRRVFTDTPYPPYENGDLWFYEGEIYICQISKTDAETYAEDDFIIAVNYTDDTVANQVGDELEVLKGTVLTVKESVDEFKVTVEDRDKATTSSIQLLKDMFATLVTDENGQSMMTQEGDKFTFSMKSVLESLNKANQDIETLGGDIGQTSSDLENAKGEIANFKPIIDQITIGSKNGKPTIELGQTGSPFRVVITNESIQFMDGNYAPAYISNKALNIKKAIVEDELQIGGFVWAKRSNGNVGLMWKGDS